MTAAIHRSELGWQLSIIGKSGESRLFTFKQRKDISPGISTAGWYPRMQERMITRVRGHNEVALCLHYKHTLHLGISVCSSTMGFWSTTNVWAWLQVVNHASMGVASVSQSRGDTPRSWTTFHHCITAAWYQALDSMWATSVSIAVPCNSSFTLSLTTTAHCLNQHLCSSPCQTVMVHTVMVHTDPTAQVRLHLPLSCYNRTMHTVWVEAAVATQSIHHHGVDIPMNWHSFKGICLATDSSRLW